ncbi:MAG: hypothetical protein KAJ07_08470 [Planctomycetes bacterium]|nr:hypothetical protein [Planctomycetota bacterium]
MVEGLWTVDFISNLNMQGSGVFVLTSDNRILGGDNGYYYIGDYKATGEDISGQIDVIRFDQSCVSVFGNVEQFNLKFNGKLVSDCELSATAFLGDTPNSIVLRAYKKESL